MPLINYMQTLSELASGAAHLLSRTSLDLITFSCSPSLLILPHAPRTHLYTHRHILLLLLSLFPRFIIRILHRDRGPLLKNVLFLKHSPSICSPFASPDEVQSIISHGCLHFEICTSCVTHLTLSLNLRCRCESIASNSFCQQIFTRGRDPLTQKQSVERPS